MKRGKFSRLLPLVDWLLESRRMSGPDNPQERSTCRISHHLVLDWTSNTTGFQVPHLPLPKDVNRDSSSWDLGRTINRMGLPSYK